MDCLCNSKIISTFAIVNEPTHEGEAIDVVVGGIVFTRHIIIRRHITLWLGYLESGKFKEVSKTLQHIDVLGICISMCMLLNSGVCSYISAWASVLLVRSLRQCEGLK